MKKTLTVILTLLSIMSYSQEKINTLTAREKAQGWKLLFDGETTNGWHSFNKPAAGAAWLVKEGILFLDTTNKSSWQTDNGGDLVTDNTYKNFHFKLDWKISTGGNSGIIFLLQEDGKHDYCWQTGPEMQIVDNDNHPDGKIVKHQAGDLYDLIACLQKTVKPAGEWNQAEIICNEGGLTLMLNNVKVVSATMWGEAWKKLIHGSKFIEMPDFGKFTSGKIALQDHGDMVSFRNIKIKEL